MLGCTLGLCEWVVPIDFKEIAARIVIGMDLMKLASEIRVLGNGVPRCLCPVLQRSSCQSLLAIGPSMSLPVWHGLQPAFRKNNQRT